VVLFVQDSRTFFLKVTGTLQMSFRQDSKSVTPRRSGGQGETRNRPGLVQAGREIEEKSFGIIDAEIGDHSFAPDHWQIIRRVIHTTGDFDYADVMRFHPQAIDSGVAALRQGATIFTDTRMMQTGLSPWRLQWFGNSVVTPPAEPESQQWAEAMGTTRSVAAFRHYARQLDGGIVAIGNSPTALLELLRLIREEGVRPALVIGAPVGFVQAAESKDALWELKELPAITILGRKGGSAVAVAIVHALLELARTHTD
jgi:precorrin-8X/cobalt-precorrin-8 methylmutase